MSIVQYFRFLLFKLYVTKTSTPLLKPRLKWLFYGDWSTFSSQTWLFQDQIHLSLQNNFDSTVQFVPLLFNHTQISTIPKLDIWEDETCGYDKNPAFLRCKHTLRSTDFVIVSFSWAFSHRSSTRQLVLKPVLH